MGDDKQNIINSIKALSGGGTTNCQHALEEAISLLDNYDSREAEGTIFFLTDGVCDNGATYVENILTTLSTKKRIRISPIAFG